MFNKKFFLGFLVPLITTNQAVANEIELTNQGNYSADNLSPNFLLQTENNLDVSESPNNRPVISQNSQNSKKIEVIGNTVFEKEIKELIKPYQNKKIDLAQAEKIAEEITQLYLNQGYITTRAIVSNMTAETATIEVLEGGVEEIIIEGAQRLENYVKDRIALGANTPLNTGKLEDQLRLLKVDPLIEKIEASLRKGNSDRQSIVQVRVQEADPFFATVGIDNYSPPSIGDLRATFEVGYGNVFGLGDSFRVNYNPRIDNWTGTYDLDLNYTVPINPMNGTITARVSLQENEVISGDFEGFDISGDSQFYELMYRQPVLRNPRQELAFSVGMRYRDGQTFIAGVPVPFGFGPDDDGNTRTNVLFFGQDYVKRDKNGAWGLQSEFRLGLGLFDVTSNSGDNPDGYFFSWLGQVQRVQVLSPENLLLMNFQLQLSSDPLLSSEQFVIGGGNSVRGYRHNIRAGDNGFRFSIEDRITVLKNDELEPVLQLAPFFDMGSVWNHPKNPNAEQDENFIAALGLGLIWQPVKGLNVRVDYAPPLIDLVDRGNNIQDDGLYFNLQYEL
jgi:hemolysin activation/secretion protein